MRKALIVCVGLLITCSLGLPRLAAQETVVVVGSGSSVPAPLYAKWADLYNKLTPGFQLRYVPIGTSEGIKNIAHGGADFGAGEAQLSGEEKRDLIELPSVVIAIVPIYNLPGVKKEVVFTGELLAEIYLGTVKNWNAPQVAKLNPGLTLPDLPIKVVYRPAGKGSNYIFSDYLSESSPTFKSAIGVSPSPKWPVGIPAERSADMAEKVKSEPGSIGYVEAQYAFKAGIAMGAVRNLSGKFIKASPQSLSEACRAVEAPGWDKFSASLINAPGADSYPITSFTWFYFRRNSTDARRAVALGDLMSWAYSDGQRVAMEEGYTELPPQLLDKVKHKVASLH